MKTRTKITFTTILVCTGFASGCQTLSVFDRSSSQQGASAQDQGSTISQETVLEKTVDVEALSSDLPVILFASGSTNLSNIARKQIRDIAPLFNHPDIINQTLTIAGHSDMTGDPDLNMALSAKRAEAVGREFVLNGIRNERLQIRALGENQPRENEISQSGQFDPVAADKNRRVEIYLGTINLENQQ